jgi:hypothetical protein
VLLGPETPRTAPRLAGCAQPVASSAVGRRERSRSPRAQPVALSAGGRPSRAPTLTGRRPESAACDPVIGCGARPASRSCGRASQLAPLMRRSQPRPACAGDAGGQARERATGEMQCCGRPGGAPRRLRPGSWRSGVRCGWRPSPPSRSPLAGGLGGDGARNARGVRSFAGSDGSTTKSSRKKVRSRRMARFRALPVMIDCCVRQNIRS